MRLLIAGLMLWVTAATAFADERPISYSTGGMLRLPNTQLPDDEGNAFFEGWFKAGITLFESSRGKVILSLRTKYISDTAGYAFNNIGTVGVELAYKMRLGKRASLTFKLRHDWNRRADGLKQNGVRFYTDYFFLNYDVPDRDAHMFGLKMKSRILKVYATLTFPETLVSGDDNITLSGGGSYGVNLALPNSRLQLSPYVALYGVIDEEGLGYNNKVQPSFGLKLKHPLPSGDIHLGLRYQGDYRWKSNRFEHGPSIFISWYSAF